MKLDNQVKLLGLRDDIKDLLSLADALVLSSRWEGMPNVILEAFAMGKPVVATATGGVAELVEEGVNGFFANPADVYSLAAKMIDMMSVTGEERVQMGTAGREKIETSFKFDVIISKWEKYLLEPGS